MKKKTLVTWTIANVALVMALAVALPNLPGRFAIAIGAEPSLLDTALRDLRSPDRNRRLAAVRVLGALADPAARTVLEELQSGPDDAVALEAADALSRLVQRPRAALEPIESGLDA